MEHLGDKANICVMANRFQKWWHNTVTMHNHKINPDISVKFIWGQRETTVARTPTILGAWVSLMGKTPTNLASHLNVLDTLNAMLITTKIMQFC